MNIPTGQNYTAWDNTEPVTLTSIARTGNTLFEISTAKRRNPSYRELAASQGVYTGQDLVWLLPASLVSQEGATGQQAVKPGDLITDGNGITWTILERSLNTLQSTYRCMTRDMILAAQLYDTLTITRPTEFETDAAGGRVYDYATIYTGIPCRFQEVDASTTDERGQRLTVKRYSVWVSQRLYLTIEDVATDSEGNVYEVRGWQDADRIDQLQRLDCEIRWAA